MKTLSLSAGAALAAAALAAAYSFAPSPPSPAPSPCAGPTSINSLPYVIGGPGLYCVSKTLQGSSGSTGISVLSGGVVIDLNGFTLEANGAAIGIDAGYNNDVTVRNGELEGWTDTALFLAGDGNSLLDVRVNASGTVTLGDHARVERFESFQSLTDGLEVGTLSVVRDSEVSYATDSGITARLRSRIENCRSTNNGFTQFDLGSDCRMVDCYAAGGNVGVNVNDDSHLSRCTVDESDNGGILGKERILLEDCTVTSTKSGPGISLRDDGRLRGCRVLDGGGPGILLGAGSVAIECAASRNAEDGFAREPSYGGAFRVERCTANGNGENGIEAAYECVILDSTCSDNALAGIRVDGNQTRIEANRLIDNGTGIRIVGKDNLIVRNSLADNTAPIAMPHGNTCGPMLTTNHWITSTNPWANFNLTFP
jgi:hypothetical protein